MLSKFERPSFENLVTEQESVQREKFQGRLLDEYSNYLFPGQKWREPRSTAVTDLLRPVCMGERVSLEGVLNGLYTAKNQQPVHWTDMGGGRGLAMRQFAANSDNRHKFVMTNVDLFDYGLDSLEGSEIEYLENLASGMTNPESSPNMIQGDVEYVALPHPADIITCVESIQYLNNPLASIGNWYNNLADNGILLITADHEWSRDIRYTDINAYEDTPSKQLLEQLDKADVSYAATYECDWDNGIRPKLDPNSFQILAIQKKPGTKMVVHSDVVELWISPHNYKAVYYSKPDGDQPPVIEIV